MPVVLLHLTQLTLSWIVLVHGTVDRRERNQVADILHTPARYLPWSEFAKDISKKYTKKVWDTS